MSVFVNLTTLESIDTGSDCSPRFSSSDRIQSLRDRWEIHYCASREIWDLESQA